VAERFPFEHRGRVEQGRRLGRLLGTPTANLVLATDTAAPFGTFAAVVEALGQSYQAVVHVGVRPSVVTGGEPILEAHLLDFDGDLYGREVVVKLEHKVAEEIRVGSLYALARKIADDVASVRAYFTGGSRARRSQPSRSATSRAISPASAPAPREMARTGSRPQATPEPPLTRVQ
jgi:riboflavin kinase/FMN adenylyltransferase